MNRLPLAVLLASALSIATVGAQERVYRWVDAQGVVHYSQTAPENVQARPMDVKTPAPAPAADAQETATPSPPSPCEAARRNRDTLLGGKALGKDKDGDGKPDPMSDAELRAAMALNDLQIANYCKPAAAPAPASTTSPPPG